MLNAQISHSCRYWLTLLCAIFQPRSWDLNLLTTILSVVLIFLKIKLLVKPHSEQYYDDCFSIFLAFYAPGVIITGFDMAVRATPRRWTKQSRIPGVSGPIPDNKQCLRSKCPEARMNPAVRLLSHCVDKRSLF